MPAYFGDPKTVRITISGEEIACHIWPFNALDAEEIEAAQKASRQRFYATIVSIAARKPDHKPIFASAEELMTKAAAYEIADAVEPILEAAAPPGLELEGAGPENPT